MLHEKVIQFLSVAYSLCHAISGDTLGGNSAGTLHLRAYSTKGITYEWNEAQLGSGLPKVWH